MGLHRFRSRHRVDRDRLSMLARRLREHCGDSGSAMVEFVVLSVALMVPLFYLVMTLARLQAGAYAVTGAAREAGRAYVTAADAAQAPGRAQAAAHVALEDQGFSADGSLHIRCDGSPCLRRDGRIEVTAEVGVPLPFVPSAFAAVVPLSVPVSATHVASVDRFAAPSQASGAP